MRSRAKLTVRATRQAIRAGGASGARGARGASDATLHPSHAGTSINIYCRSTSL